MKSNIKSAQDMMEDGKMTEWIQEYRRKHKWPCAVQIQSTEGRWQTRLKKIQ